MLKDPNQLRSMAAEFDPTKKSSADLLASRIAPVVGAGSAAAGIGLLSGNAADAAEFQGHGGMGILSDEITTGNIVSGMPSRLMERDIRRITAKIQAGEPLTPAEKQAFSRHQAYQAETDSKVANAGIEATGVPGFLRAGSDMIEDPSLANATNVGMRGAVMALKPLAAVKIAAGGYGLAAARDLSGGLLSDAQAADDGLTSAQAKRLKQLQEMIGKGKWSSGAERRAIEDEAKGLRDIQAQFAAQNNAAAIGAKAKEKEQQQAEYDRAVQGAERMRDDIRATNRSFKDSEVGKIYEKTGGLTPAIAGLAGGMIGRMAHGGGASVKALGLPALEGTGAAFATMNAPLFYDAFSTPALNPERQALETYARELPPEHPRKQEFQTYAGQLPQLNPIRESARDELFSPTGNLRRLGASALEGGIAGITGGNMVPAARKALEGVGEIPGAIAGGYQRGMTRATEAATDRAKQAGLLSEVRATAGNAERLAAGESRAAAQVVPTSVGLRDLPASPAAAPPSPPQPAPVQNQLAALSAPKEPRQWAQIWSDPARAAIADTTSKGLPLSAITAPNLRDMIISQLPPGAPHPAISTVREYLANLKKAVPGGEQKGLLRLFDSDPGRQVFGLGGPAIAAGGLGLLSMDDR